MDAGEVFCWRPESFLEELERLKPRDGALREAMERDVRLEEESMCY